MSESHPVVDGAFAVGRLIGVPSVHHDPIFAKVAIQAMTALKPTIVVLELPEGLLPELDWAASCWPGPVVSESSNVLFPFIAGDSIFEAFRAARAAGLPVVLVDLPTSASVSKQDGSRPLQLPGPEFSRVPGGLFLDSIDALCAHAGPPAPEDLAREAHMARWIDQFLHMGETVLWVGGMAHWTRIVARVALDDFDEPDVDLTSYAEFRRMRIAPSALYRMTQRLPWLVARYAQEALGYEEHAAVQKLCLEAARAADRESVVLMQPGQSESCVGSEHLDETASAIHVARTLQYARNLAAVGGLRERPDFGELLTSAAATIGPRYAGRLYELAMAEQCSSASGRLESLEWEVVDGLEWYRCGNRLVSSRPWRPARGRWMLSHVELQRRADDEFYKDLPRAGEESKTRWECPPNEEADYVSFVQYVLRRASLAAPEEPKQIPFQNGLGDGLDVRATLRNWAQGNIFVREEQRGRMNFTNGAIDWVNTSEHSEILTGKRPGGWIDPDLTQLGSCSRTTRNWELLQKDPHGQRDYRDFTFITLDCPTFYPNPPAGEEEDREPFFNKVILELVQIERKQGDNLHAWLDIMFRFCAGKPFAYYSRYVPSPEVHRIAWRHKVEVVHFPLQRLPANLLRRHSTFRFFAFTREQWEEFQRRRSANTAMWFGGGS